MLQAFHVLLDDFAANLPATRVIFYERFSSEEIVMLSTFIDAGLSVLMGKIQEQQRFLDSQSPLANLAHDYLNALLNTDRREADRLIMDAVAEGTTIPAIYLDVFQRVEYELGRLWQTNVISGAQEHYCTAETQRLMARLLLYFPSVPRSGRVVVADCVGGEFHDMGIRMVSDFFEMAGWETFYLGANTPSRGMVSTLIELNPDVLALSATITSHPDNVRQIVQGIRARDELKLLKSIAGGYPFNVAPKLWREIGADGCADNGERAVRLADSLVPTGKRRK